MLEREAGRNSGDDAHKIIRCEYILKKKYQSVINHTTGSLEVMWREKHRKLTEKKKKCKIFESLRTKDEKSKMSIYLLLRCHIPTWGGRD